MISSSGGTTNVSIAAPVAVDTVIPLATFRDVCGTSLADLYRDDFLLKSDGPHRR